MGSNDEATRGAVFYFDKIDTNMDCDSDGVADFVDNCFGAYNPLQEAIEKKGIPCQVAGDAHKVGLAFNAVHGGFAAGRNI